MSEIGYFKNVKTAYEHVGKGRDVILLHGWGQKMIMMSAIQEHLKDHFSVYNIDLPGHGESDDPPVPWGVEDYESFLEDFIIQNHIQDPILIGHSFGCRFAIHYAAHHHDVYKMVLTGAAGIKPKQSSSTSLKTKMYKAGKWFLQKTGNTEALEKYQSKHGSTDYRNAKGVMRPSFVKIVNDDVTPLLKDITCPVLLVWGDQDDAAPLYMGKIMEKEIPNAGLAIFEGDDHFAYWHQSDRFNRVLDVFFKGDYPNE